MKRWTRAWMNAGMNVGVAFGVLLLSAALMAADDSDKADKSAKPDTDAKTALQFIYEGDAGIADYLKQHKCVIGSWELKKKTDFGWEGNLHYACANHRPGGVRYVEGPLKVLKPKGFTPPMDAKFDGFGNQVVLKQSKKEGYFEIVAFVVPIEEVEGKRWLAGVGDLDWAGIYEKKYRYTGIVPDAAKQLQSDNATKRAEAARVLNALGADAVDALPSLIEHVGNEKDEHAREACVRAIGTVGYGKIKEILPTLIASLDDGVPEVRMAAAQAIAFQGDQAKAAIDPLIKASADASKFVRIEAVRALAHLGVNEPRVIAHLEKLAQSDDAALAQSARRALQKIESDTPVEPQP